MRTVRIVLAVAVALLIAAPLLAQEQERPRRDRGSPMRRAFLMMERLRDAMKELDLTAEQKEKLDKIREEAGPKGKDLWDKANEVLTEEQRSAAGEAMRQAREAGKTGREAVDAVEAALKLTDEQKKKLDPIGEEMLTLQRELMTKITEVLTPEQREKLREKMRPQRRRPAEQAEPAKPAEPAT